jgi:tetratricopeptide (TPR) repeat protein
MNARTSQGSGVRGQGSVIWGQGSRAIRDTLSATHYPLSAIRYPLAVSLRWQVLWSWALVAVAAGCAGLDVPEPPIADVAKTRSRRTEEAVRDFEAKRDHAELQAALAHWNQGDVEGYEAALRRLLNRNPHHPEARRLLAEICPADNEFQGDVNQIQRAQTARSSDAHVQYATGLLLRATGQGDTALAYYERAAELNPVNELYRAGYQTALEAGDPVEAFSVDSTGLPGDSFQISAGPALVSPAPTAEPVEPASTHAEDQPDRPKATRRWGVCADATPAHRAAEETTQPTIILRCATGEETSDRVDPADSAEAADSAHSVGHVRCPTDGRVPAEFDRRWAALAEGPGEAALAHFQKKAADSPDNPQIPIAAALAALRDDRPELAIELLAAAERRSADSAQLYRILGVAYYRLGDYQSSQVALRQALSLDKSSALSYFLMGCTLSKLGQFESAEAHLRQARTMNPRYAVQW